MGVTAAVVAVVGTAASIDQQQKAAKKQREAGRVQNAGQKAQETAQRRQQLREQRIRRAQILQAGEGTGTSGSSGVFGATSGVTAQTQSNIAFTKGQTLAAEGASTQLQSAATHTLNANIWGQIGQIGISQIPTSVEQPTGVKGQNTKADLSQFNFDT